MLFFKPFFLAIVIIKMVDCSEKSLNNLEKDQLSKKP